MYDIPFDRSFLKLSNGMTCYAIYWQKARINSKGIDGSDRLTDDCVLQWTVEETEVDIWAQNILTQERGSNAEWRKSLNVELCNFTLRQIWLRRGRQTLMGARAQTVYKLEENFFHVHMEILKSKIRSWSLP